MGICEKCHKQVKDDSKHCSACGGKVLKEQEHRKKLVKKHNIVVSILIGLLIVLLIAPIVVFAVPFPYKAIEQYTEQQPYTATEYYFEKEPYDAKEHYSESEPYDDVETYNERVPRTVCGSYTIFGNCKSFKTVYDVVKKTRPVIKYTDVVKSRQVTKYRDVEKSRIVTKYRTIEKERDVQRKDTLFNMWTGKTKYYFRV